MKSELEYLLEALDAARDGAFDELRGYVHRAIDLRKQDREKAVAPTFSHEQVRGILKNEQPKGGGDDLSKRLRNWMTTPFGIHGTAELCDEAASALDALLAERDAARAELKEAVQLLRTVNKSYWQSPEGDPALLNAIENIGPFFTRVGKQP